MRALTDFAKALTAARWSDDVLTTVATEALHALDADSVSLSVWERESGWLRTLVNVGSLGPHEEERPTTELYPIGTNAQAWERLESGRGFVASLPTGAVPADDYQRLLAETGKASCLSVPVLVDGRLWGEMWATRGADRTAFGAADLDFAAAVAVQVAAGVGQAEHLARVERLAYSDALTGLANRRVLEDHLDAAMARHVDEGTPVTLAVADLNELKRINDERGHHAGDAALRMLAHHLSAAAGELEGAVAARLGGDEFALLAVGLPADHVVDVVARLAVGLRRGLPDGASIGIAGTEYLGDRVESAAALMRMADAAQYRAKRTGRLEPVVAGRPVEGASTDAAAGRRRWRDRGVDVGAALVAVAAALDNRSATGSQGRVTAVAEVVCGLVDGASWWVSRVPAGSDRMFTSASGVTRVPSRHGDAFRSFFDDADGYPAADFPESRRALGGVAVVVAADDRDADPAEAALLDAGGFVAMLMAGATDRHGDGWLVEIFTDEISAPASGYALVLRACVAMAVVGP